VSLPPDTVGEGIIFLDCPVVLFIYPFVWSAIVTTISHSWTAWTILI